jgi:hypothetical protein
LKRNVCATYVFDSELEIIHEWMDKTGWGKTEVASFFIHWAMNHCQLKSNKEFMTAFNEEMATAQLNEYKKTASWRMDVEKAVKEKQNVRSGEKS